MNQAAVVDSISSVEISDGGSAGDGKKTRRNVFLIYWTSFQRQSGVRASNTGCLAVDYDPSQRPLFKFFFAPLVLLGVGLPPPRAAPTLAIIGQRRENHRSIAAPSSGGGGSDMSLEMDIVLYGGEHLQRSVVPAGCAMSEDRPSRLHDMFTLHLDRLPQVGQELGTGDCRVDRQRNYDDEDDDHQFFDEATVGEESPNPSTVVGGSSPSRLDETTTAVVGAFAADRALAPSHRPSAPPPPSNLPDERASISMPAASAPPADRPRTPVKRPSVVSSFLASHPSTASVSIEPSKISAQVRPAAPAGPLPPPPLPPPRESDRTWDTQRPLVPPTSRASPSRGPSDEVARRRASLQPPVNRAPNSSTSLAGPKVADSVAPVSTSIQQQPVSISPDSLSPDTSFTPPQILLSGAGTAEVAAENNAPPAATQKDPVVIAPAKVMISQQIVIFIDQLCAMMQRKLLIRNTERRRHLHRSSSSSPESAVTFMNTADFLQLLYWLGAFHRAPFATHTAEDPSRPLFIDSALDVVTALFPNVADAAALLAQPISVEEFKSLCLSLVAHASLGDHFRHLMATLAQQHKKTVFDLIDEKLSVPYDPNMFQFPVMKASESEPPNVKLLLAVCVEGPQLWQQFISTYSSAGLAGSKAEERHGPTLVAVIKLVARYSVAVRQWEARSGHEGVAQVDQAAEYGAALIERGGGSAVRLLENHNRNDAFRFVTVVSMLCSSEYKSRSYGNILAPFVGVEQARSGMRCCAFLEAVAGCCILVDQLNRVRSSAAAGGGIKHEDVVRDLLSMLMGKKPTAGAVPPAKQQQAAVCSKGLQEEPSPRQPQRLPNSEQSTSAFPREGAADHLLVLPAGPLDEVRSLTVTSHVLEECVRHQIFLYQPAIFAKFKVAPLCPPTKIKLPLTASAAPVVGLSYSEEFISRQFFVKIVHAAIPRHILPARTLADWINNSLMVLNVNGQAASRASESEDACVPFWSTLAFVSCQHELRCSTDAKGAEASMRSSFAFFVRLVRDLML